MRKYFIDGNNLIHKDIELVKLQYTDRKLVREKLVHILEGFAAGKNIEIYVFFDGFEGDAIPSRKVRIRYSRDKSADVYLKREIDNEKNPRNLIVVSSDTEIVKFARAHASEIRPSEMFCKVMRGQGGGNDEEERLKGLENSEDEFKRLFGV